MTGYVFDDEIELPFIDYETGRPDPRFDGLEVVARSVTLDLFAEATMLTGRGLVPIPANVDAIERFTGIVGGSLIRWNLKDPDGTPVPCDVEHLRSRPKTLRLAICNAWTAGQAEITPDFGDGSTDGSPPAPIPMRSQAS